MQPHPSSHRDASSRESASPAPAPHSHQSDVQSPPPHHSHSPSQHQAPTPSSHQAPCTLKASFNSNNSTSSFCHPARFNTFCTPVTGASITHFGATPLRRLRLDRHQRLQPQLLRLLRRHHHHRRRCIVHTRSIPRRHRPVFLERPASTPPTPPPKHHRARSHRARPPSPRLSSPATLTDATSASNRPSFHAALAFRCDASANASCSSRVIECFSANVLPCNAHVIVPHTRTTTHPSPSNPPPPSRPCENLSAPVAAGKAHSTSTPSHLRQQSPHRPAITACAASATAFSPDPQTILIVIAETRIRQPTLQRRLPRRILSQPRRQHASHQALIDTRSIDPSPLHCLAHRNRTQLYRRHLRKRPLKLPTGVRTAATSQHPSSIEIPR